MADTTFDTGNALTVKLWEKALSREALYRTYAQRFMSQDGTTPIHIKTDLQKSAGDLITFGLRMQLNNDGVLGDGTLEGNEEALVTYTDQIVIDQLRNAVRSGGRMSEQRVHFSVRKEALDGLADWYAGRTDESFFNQVAGNTITGTDARRTGNQAAVDPSTNRFLIVGAHANEDAITSGDILTLKSIDAAVEAARTTAAGIPLIRPMRIDGNDRFVVFVHEYQRTSLRTNTSDGQWLDITKAIYQGTRQENPIYWGALGEYNGTVMHPTDRLPNGKSDTGGTAITTVRRAVLMGCQAAAVGFGMGDGPARYTWVEETFDYGNKLGVASGSIWGLKKTQFNSEDYGTIVISSYATATTA